MSAPLSDRSPRKGTSGNGELGPQFFVSTAGAPRVSHGSPAAALPVSRVPAGLAWQARSVRRADAVWPRERGYEYVGALGGASARGALFRPAAESPPALEGVSDIAVLWVAPEPPVLPPDNRVGPPAAKGGALHTLALGEALEASAPLATDRWACSS